MAKKNTDADPALIIRRAKALLTKVRERTSAYSERVRKYKAGDGPYHGLGPTLEDFFGDFRAIRAAIEEYEGNGGPTAIPFKSETKGTGVHEEFVETHESYGMFSFRRQHGGRGEKHLFGSRVQHHPVTIALVVQRAERQFNKDLSSDHTFGREELLEIEMSAAQFTDAITLMNHGDGIPCTIRRVGRVRMEDVPTEHRSETHMIVDGFKKKMSDLRESAKGEIGELEQILAKKSIGKGDRKEIARLFESVLRRFTDNAGFTLNRFNEATSRLETEAKKEVEAYLNSMLVAAGLRHLAGEGMPSILPEASTEMPALEAGEDG